MKGMGKDDTGPGDQLVGRTLTKFIEDKSCTGKVVSCEASVVFYKVVYEDGDEEDLQWSDLKPLLENGPPPTSPQGKRGRGRPKKSKPEEEIDVAQEENVQGEEKLEELEGATGAKHEEGNVAAPMSGKKRGRPPKNAPPKDGVATPKKRGRPPKSKDKDAGGGSLASEVATPKKRGRPPKVKIAAEESTPKRKPGRPPKNALASPSTDEKKVDEAPKSPAADGPATPSSPKRRGRPPKNPKETQQNGVATPEKRKPGRPPKAESAGKRGPGRPPKNKTPLGATPPPPGQKKRGRPPRTSTGQPELALAVVVAGAAEDSVPEEAAAEDHVTAPLEFPAAVPDENQSLEAATPKKRGRPPKQKQGDLTSGKKRGRPPKNPSAKIAAPATGPPKKRGRPPKNKAAPEPQPKKLKSEGGEVAAVVAEAGEEEEVAGGSALEDGEPGEGAIGLRLQKFFEKENRVCAGVVMSYDVQDRYYKIQYDDGDLEEQEWAELRRHLI